MAKWRTQTVKGSATPKIHYITTLFLKLLFPITMHTYVLYLDFCETPRTSGLQRDIGTIYI